MYKDFKKSESLDTGFVGGSGIMWMFSGIVLGLLVGIGMYYFSNNSASSFSGIESVQRDIKQAQLSQPKLTSKKPATTKRTTKVEPKSREHKFSYYAVLPTLDVPVNTAKPIETRKELISATQKSKKEETIQEIAKLENEELPALTSVAKSGNYLLQVASYRKKSKANFTRGRLSKKGVEAYIQKKKIKGRLWYRVVAGPVDQNGADAWKTKAEKLGHRPMIISLR